MGPEFWLVLVYSIQHRIFRSLTRMGIRMYFLYLMLHSLGEYGRNSRLKTGLLFLLITIIRY
jgi:hypothetical protein